jgi:hypothetical protein
MNPSVEEHNKVVASMFDTAVPFTITIDNGHDAALLSSALMLWCCGDDKKALEIIHLMLLATRLRPVEEAVDAVIKQGQMTGHYFPKFMKPMLVHLVTNYCKKSREHENTNRS